MPKIKASLHFKKSFTKLPSEIQAKVLKALSLLAENPRHPSLQAKSIQGIMGVFEARVDVSYRMTYERLPGNVLFLRSVGKHDETLRDP